MLLVAFCGTIAMLANDSDDDTSNIIFVYAGTFITLIPGIIGYIIITIREKKPTLLHWFNILIIWMTLVVIAYSQYNLIGTFTRCFKMLIPLAMLCTTYAYASQYGINKQIHWASVGMLIIFIAQYISIYNVANMLSEAHLITSYYPLFLLPLVLMHPSKLIRYAAMLIVSLVVFSSIKRGGLIALSVGLLVYILCYRHTTSHGIKAVIYSCITLGMLSILFYYIANSDYGGVIERIISIQDDGGSGRTDVWDTTWSMISESDTFQYIFGHGENAVIRDSPMFLSAHNDFMEAWYDYGLVGLFLYSCSLLSLLRYTKRHIHSKAPTAPSMAMLFTIMIVLTNISHVLIYYFMILCCMTIGLLVGQDQYDERNE